MSCFRFCRSFARGVIARESGEKLTCSVRRRTDESGARYRPASSAALVSGRRNWGGPGAAWVRVRSRQKSGQRHGKEKETSADGGNRDDPGEIR